MRVDSLVGLSLSCSLTLLLPRINPVQIILSKHHPTPTHYPSRQLGTPPFHQLGLNGWAYLCEALHNRWGNEIVQTTTQHFINNIHILILQQYWKCVSILLHHLNCRFKQRLSFHFNEPIGMPTWMKHLYWHGVLARSLAKAIEIVGCPLNLHRKADWEKGFPHILSSFIRHEKNFYTPCSPGEVLHILVQGRRCTVWLADQSLFSRSYKALKTKKKKVRAVCQTKRTII